MMMMIKDIFGHFLYIYLIGQCSERECGGATCAKDHLGQESNRRSVLQAYANMEHAPYPLAHRALPIA